MRKLFFLAATGLFIFGVASCNTNNSPKQTPASELIDRLNGFAADKTYAFGHHDDVAYGVNWSYCPDSSDVKNVVGDYPAILDWDLGEIELRGDLQLDSVPLSFIHERALAHAQAGGINSFSWHLRNPVNGGDAWNIEAGDVVAACLTDPSLNDTLRTWIGLTADFIGSLTDSTGRRVPVIFRPWHEHTGSWFWWGADHCTPDEYKALWRLTREVFDSKGIDNVVWAYSPGNCSTVEEYTERYPGDEYIDIMGFDTYQFPTDSTGVEPFMDRLRTTFDVIAPLAQEHGKVLALCEAGDESLLTVDWFTQALSPVLDEYPVAYVVVWRNANKNSKPGHFYAPYPGHPAAADFLKFYQQPSTLFLNDLATSNN